MSCVFFQNVCAIDNILIHLAIEIFIYIITVCYACVFHIACTKYCFLISSLPDPSYQLVEWHSVKVSPYVIIMKFST